MAAFVSDDGKSIDWNDMERAVRASIRFLDDVIEVNPYPLQEIVEMVGANRRIGLGVMGWADLLFKMGIPYDSEQALNLADELMSFINRIGHSESEKLAVERGPFPNWDHSIYKDGAPLRNSTVTTIAPTGTISIIADCSTAFLTQPKTCWRCRVTPPAGERARAATSALITTPPWFAGSRTLGPSWWARPL